MRISYHAWKDFKDCPRKFNLQYIEKKAPLVPKNDYFTLYGKLVEKFFGAYCNIWRFKTPYIFPEIIRERLEKLWLGVELSSSVDWSAPYVNQTKEQIFEQAYADVCKIMESMNQNYFLNTRSELSIELRVSSGHTLSGRLDFIHMNLDKSTIIFDGKGTSEKGKNISNDQLYFYALLYFLHYKSMPEQLGFFYYKLNYFDPIPFNLDILNEFRAEVSLSLKALPDNKFLPTPSAKACKYCPYLPGCSEGMKGKVSRMRKSKVDIKGDGLVVFGLD